MTGGGILWPSLDDAFLDAMCSYTLAPSNQQHVAALITADCVAALQEDITRKIERFLSNARG